MKRFLLFGSFILLCFSSFAQENHNTFIKTIDWEESDRIVLDGKEVFGRNPEKNANQYIFEDFHIRQNILNVKAIFGDTTYILSQSDFQIQSLIGSDHQFKRVYLPAKLPGRDTSPLQFKIEFSFSLSPATSQFRSESVISSVLSEGEFYKIPITESGVYKIDQQWFRSHGISTSNLDFAKIRLFGHDAGVLPQKNNTPRPTDLQEIPFLLTEASEIVFFARNQNSTLQIEQSHFEFINHPYATSAFVYLQINAPLDRIPLATHSSATTADASLNWYQEIWHHERDLVNLMESGRTWYGEKIDHGNQLTLNPNLSGLIFNQNHHIRMVAASRSTSIGRMTISANNSEIGSVEYNAISGQRYDFQGSREEGNISFLLGGTFNNLKLNYTGSSGSSRHALLDFITLNIAKEILLKDEPIFIRNATLNPGEIIEYTIKTDQPNTFIWDVSTYSGIKQLNQFTSTGTHSFLSKYQPNQTLVAFSLNRTKECPSGQKINNQNIRNLQASDFIIISHPSLISEARRLANHRSTHSQIEVSVVSTEQVFNEFSGGKQDITAIRDFVRHQYLNHDKQLKNVLIFGKGTYDPKNILGYNRNLAPIYQSRESLHELLSFASDDYLGFMDDEEGEWRESRIGDHLMDIGVGRIPAKSAREASDVVNKIIYYDTDPNRWGNWRNKLVFIADDGDNNIHMRDAERLVAQMQNLNPGIIPEKIFLDAFPLISSQSGPAYPAVVAKIENELEEGALIINYTGHGNFDKLADETIIDRIGISRWRNLPRLPFFVTATCEFGRHDMPNIISGGEELILNNRGGAIGLVTTSRPVFSFTNFQLNQAFCEVVLSKSEEGHLTLGEIQKETKNNSLNGSLNRNFILLADPSMKLAAPDFQVQLESINSSANNSPIDTLKALTKAKVYGKITSWENNEKISTNGKVVISLLDKPEQFSTLGNRGNQFNYSKSDNLLARSEAEVINGEFTCEIFLPKNIEYTPDQGILQFYYVSDNQQMDATGSSPVIIGFSEDLLTSDNQGPQITILIGDENFDSSKPVSPDSRLIVRLSDQSGINITNERFGQSLRAEINEELTLLNQHYRSINNSYTEGEVVFPLKNLLDGENTVKVMAWDNLNNYAESLISFLVGDFSGLTIQNLTAYPNPFVDEVNLHFSHNREGDDLEVTLQIINLTGQVIWEEKRDYIFSWSDINDITIKTDETFFRNTERNVYILHLNVRSMKDGVNSTATKKLIKAN